MEKKTFAQEAKIIMNRYKLRLGDKFDKSDPLALAAMNQELEALQQKQEAVRETELGLPSEAAPQFAKGGLLPEYEGLDPNQSAYLPATNIYNFQTGTAPKLTAPQGIGSLGAFQSQQEGSGLNAFNDSFNLGSDPGDFINTLGDSPAVQDPFKSRVPWMGAVGDMIGGLIGNKELDLPEYNYEEWKPTQARANLVDYSRGREQTMRERDQAQAMITRNARGTGSQAGLMENILAGATGTQRAAGQAFNQSLEQEGNVNAQIKNQVSQFNAAQQAQAAQMNSRNQLYANQLDREGMLINDQRRQNRIGSVTDAISGYMGDRQQAGQYDQMVNMEMARNPNFGLRQAQSNFWRKAAGITDPIEELTVTNTNDYTNKK